MDELKAAVKEMLVEGLNLLDTAPTDIGDDTPLFGEGLGLDSLDAVELTVLLKKRYGIEVEDMAAAKPAFQTVATLAAFIEKHRKP